jgi:hypothetical protein
VHKPPDLAHDVELGFSPNWPAGCTVELTCAGGIVFVLVPAEGLTGTGVTALEDGTESLVLGAAGTFAGDEELGADALDDGAALDGAATGVVAAAELDGDGAIDEGSGLDSPFLTGRVPFLIIKSAWVTSRADICWPTPEVPSQPPVYHFEPHVVPSAPPEQDFAAPTAEALRYDVMVSLVNGARRAVFAMKRARYALKDCWSRLQWRPDSPVSQAHSYMTFVEFSNGEKKRVCACFRKPEVLSFQVLSPLVKSYMKAEPCKNIALLYVHCVLSATLSQLVSSPVPSNTSKASVMSPTFFVQS